jgi:hypothetical protein
MLVTLRAFKHWTSLAGVEMFKKKNNKEMAVMTRLKNTTHLQRRRHVGSLQNNYICLPFEYTDIWPYLYNILTVKPISIRLLQLQGC